MPRCLFHKFTASPWRNWAKAQPTVSSVGRASARQSTGAGLTKWTSSTNSSPQNVQQSLTRVAHSVVLVALALSGILAGVGLSASPTRQEDVARRGAQVMPFDLEQTMHMFQPLADGGLQTVTAKDPANSQQIALIQAHLKEEAEKFRQGDFSDPTKIHGEDMPGLAALKAGARQIEIQYTPLPNGAQIHYATKDSGLIMALHQWFAAQRSDHGRHAVGHH